MIRLKNLIYQIDPILLDKHFLSVDSSGVPSLLQNSSCANLAGMRSSGRYSKHRSKLAFFGLRQVLVPKYFWGQLSGG
jgi:hypothetical protein